LENKLGLERWRAFGPAFSFCQLAGANLELVEDKGTGNNKGKDKIQGFFASLRMTNILLLLFYFYFFTSTFTFLLL
jgi:hypothetical protein